MVINGEVGNDTCSGNLAVSKQDNLWLLCYSELMPYNAK